MKVKLQHYSYQLSKNEQKNISGGMLDEASRYRSCTCIGGYGSWTYSNPAGASRETVERDVSQYCASGSATCTRAD